MAYTKPTSEEIKLFREEEIARLTREIEALKKYLADATADWEKRHLTRSIEKAEELIKKYKEAGDKPIVWD